MACLLVGKICSIQVFDDTKDNATTTENSEKNYEKLVTTESLTEELPSESENNSDYRITTTSTTTTSSHKIPPTLLNVKLDKPKSLKELA